MNFQLCNKADVSLLDWYEQNGYLASRKIDGTRAVASITDRKVSTLIGRSGYTYENKFPEICEELIRLFPDNTIIDGELCCSTFQQTQSRTLTKDKYKIAELIKKYPAKFYVFDILKLRGEDLTTKPLKERLEILENNINTINSINYISYISHTLKIKKLWEQAQKEEWEGIVIKNPNSVYQGKRSNDWLKLKCLQRRVIEFITYSLNNAGVRAVSKDGIVVQVSGEQSKKFINLHNKNKKVNVEVEFLSEFGDSKKLRMPVCKGVLD